MKITLTTVHEAVAEIFSTLYAEGRAVGADPADRPSNEDIASATWAQAEVPNPAYHVGGEGEWEDPTEAILPTVPATLTQYTLTVERRRLPDVAAVRAELQCRITLRCLADYRREFREKEVKHEAVAEAFAVLDAAGLHGQAAILGRALTESRWIEKAARAASQIVLETQISYAQ